MIVDCAVYGEGHRLERDKAVTGVRAEAAAASGFAWVGLVEPTAQEFHSVRREFDLHELAVEDAISAHQRPKLEIYGDTLFLVVKTARYLGSEELEHARAGLALRLPGRAAADPRHLRGSLCAFRRVGWLWNEPLAEAMRSRG